MNPIHPFRATPAAPRRPLRLGRGMRLLLFTLLVAQTPLLLGACASATYDLPPGGLSPGVSTRLSLVVAQTRAQFPALSATALPFQFRKGPAEAPAPVEPALIGVGQGVRPGVQMGSRPQVTVRLLLDKSSYAQGTLYLSVAGGPEEAWSIAAYDKRGDPLGNFDFSYLLKDTEGRVRYLVLIGGTYEEGGRTYAGYEGTLVQPGAGGSLDPWEMAYKLNFGYRFADPPEYLALVEQSEQTLDTVASLLRDLERATETARAARQALDAAGNQASATAPAPQGPPATPGSPRIDRAALEQASAEAQARVRTLGGTLVARFLDYFRLRVETEAAYAEFATGNRFRWRDRAGQGEYHRRWRATVEQNARIDALVARFLALMPGNKPVPEAREEAQAAVKRHNNHRWFTE